MQAPLVDGLNIVQKRGFLYMLYKNVVINLL